LIFNQTTSRGEFRPMKITWSKQTSDFVFSSSFYIRHENVIFVLNLKNIFLTSNFVANCDKVKRKKPFRTFVF